MSTRVNRNLFTALRLNADSDLAASKEITVGTDGFIGLQVLIDNGAGAAPTDSPAGTWELHASAGSRFTPIAGIATLVTELAKAAPAGNALVDVWVIVSELPGSRVKLKYKRTSGGAGDSRATVDVSTW